MRRIRSRLTNANGIVGLYTDGASDLGVCNAGGDYPRSTGSAFIPTTGPPPPARLKRLLTLALVVALLDPATASAQPHVLDVGDSHTWLGAEFLAWPNWHVDARPGRASTEGYAVLDALLTHSYRKVVFDLATNDSKDPATFGANLRRVWDRIGPHRQLYLVTSCLPCCPTRPDGVNAVIFSLAELHPQRITVIDWGSEAASHPEWWSRDAIHFTRDGYEARATMLRSAVKSRTLKSLQRHGGHFAAAAARS
jgi:lysophospholipase L1-like esterase